jgi:hypothetical protein
MTVIPPLISPIAHAAFRRTLAFAWPSAAIKGSTAGCPIAAKAIAASSPGDACLKVASAGLQEPLSPQHFTGSMAASSPSI